MKTLFTTAVISVLASVTLYAADDTNPAWPSFRNGGGSQVSGSLPLTWSPKRDIAWQVETSGYGQSAPVIFADRVYVTSAIGPQKQQCAVTAFELSTGDQVWQSRVDAAQQGPSNYMYSRAAPTPVVDAGGVFAFFESGDLISLQQDGSRRWHRNLSAELGPFESNHGLGSSLAQTSELLLLNIEHKGPSHLLAVAKDTGEIVWKVDRPSGSSWTSPVVTPDAVIVSSAGELTACALADGRPLWTISGLEGNSVPSPCVVGKRVYTGARIPEFGSAADAARSNICVELPTGESTEATILWRSRGAVCDYASPVVDGDRVYFLNKVGVLSCLNATSGEPLFRTRLGAECWATPVVAANGIYFFARNGTAKVIARGPEFELLQTNRLWDPANAPQPEVYREAERGGHGHGHGASTAQSADAGKTDAGKTPPAGEQSAPRRGPGGMVAALMSRDANGDGRLQPEELSAEFRPMMKRVDTNADGTLDQSELDAMAKSFAERRKNSRESSRDPIVYGVAAVPGTIIVRTGTRLYCLRQSAEQTARMSGNGSR